ncbi:FH2-domain-containing protein [Daedalea quercina L-15889]|uniref:FH2-domain-containing protein n=1 Tax=Daedalea quercina L-15889 TaxID=1314783 RepID=A0A165S1U3_9APHY|nr:FH2-domain-containing protein [Daedalea quercina L-15889]
MPDDALIVPTVLPSGSLHFATVGASATVQDVTDTLLQDQEVSREILGDLEDFGWALQSIRAERNGRQWSEEDLEGLGNGIISPPNLVAPLLNAPSPTARSERHFSAFPLTSHLHTPVLRLVSLHPFLALTCSFLRVPEIHDGFQWKIFIARTTTVREAVDLVIEQLGLMKALPVPGSGALDYVLEEVWSQDDVEKSSRLPFTSAMSSILESPYTPNPFVSSPSTASRSFRFCVPDEWYRRSKSRQVSTTSTEPSEDTIRRLADLEELDESDEAEGTAKQKDLAQPEAPASPTFSMTTDWRASISQNRFSSMFESWIRPTSPEIPVGATAAKEKIVSEPKLVEQHTGGTIVGNAFDSTDEDPNDLDELEFEHVLDELGLKGAKREQMHQLPLEKKQFLLHNQTISRSSTVSRATGARQTAVQTSVPSTYGPASASALLPRLVPQLTGDSGIMKRLSIASWGSAGSSSPSPAQRSSGDFTHRRRDSAGSTKSQVDGATPTLQPQSTGGLWSSWWASSGGEKGAALGAKEAEKTPKWYVDGIRNGRATDMKLVKHLISLRVHLSTASLVWIEEFLSEENGMDAIGKILGGLVSKGGKRRKLTDIEETVLLEIIKCLRVLLNTEPGFSNVLNTPTLITHIAYSLHGSSVRRRTLTSEVLAAICVLSLTEGHKAVLAAMSDYRVEFEEAFRFQELITSLRLPEVTDDGAATNEFGYSNEEEGVWEARTASMALINALTNCPDALEERILLREEFGRRGLNEVIVTLRYIKPPDSLVTQLDVYTEEKFEDEEDMRERARNLVGEDHAQSSSEPVVDHLLQVARDDQSLYTTLLQVMTALSSLLERDIDNQLKGDLLNIVDKFAEEISTLNDLEGSWTPCLNKFTASVQHVTGEILEVRAPLEGHESILSEELEALRASVDSLSQERSGLRSQVAEQAAEIKTLRALTSGPATVGRGGGNLGTESKQSFHGVVQRLVQKEKEASQLQAELEKLKAQNPSEGRDADERAKRERDRVKWNTLMEEIAKLKMQNGEIEVSLGMKDKEIVYLKRALESVYSRFRLREEEHKEGTKEAEVDAEMMATRAIASLTEKDEEISTLRTKLQELEVQLAAKPKYITESAFKRQVAPPPPPPGPPKTCSAAATANDIPGLPAAGAPSHPPPPPPPPPRATSQEPSTPTAETPPPPVASSPPSPPPPRPSVSLVNGHGSTCPPPPPPPPPPPAPGIPTSSAPPPPPPPPGTLPPPPPGPPPPPSAYKRPLKTAKPAKRLKPFFWNKLSAPALGSTVWTQIQTDAPFDLTDLEATFAIDNSSASPSQLSVSSPRKQSVTTLLDITRANNIAIMLSGIKRELPEIRLALLTLDDSKLSIDDLRAISRQLPTAEEIARLRGFDDVSKLAKADQYFFEIMTIPRLSQRLECMLYRQKLEIEIEEIRPELNIVRNASHELRSSSRFKSVLQAVLAVGNALNGSTFRGSARGFQLEALSKMKETRTARGGPECPTLLHYLAKVLLRTNANLVLFIEDMPHLEAAARVSVQTLSTSVQSLVEGMKHVMEEIRMLQGTPRASGDRFIAVMQPFVKTVSPSVDALKNMAVALDNELRALLAFYGEDPNGQDAPKPEEFFGLILSFSSSLQKAALDVHDAEEKNKEAAPKTISEEQPPSQSQLAVKQDTAPSSTPGLLAPPSSQGRAGGRSIGRGDFDQAILTVRTGRLRPRVPKPPASKIFMDGARTSRIFD